MRGPTKTVEVDPVPEATLKPDHEKVTSTLACHACQLLGVENGRPQRRPRPSQAERAARSASASHTPGGQCNGNVRRRVGNVTENESRLVLL